VAAACAALVAAAPSAAAGRVVERGIVQSVGPAEVVLRALDGTAVAVEVGPATRVRLNGRPAPLAAIREGFVAEAVTVGDGPARVVRAFGRADGRVLAGEIVAVRPRALVVLRANGRRVRVPLAARAAVWHGSDRIPLRSLRAGMRIQVVRTAAGPARVVIVRTGT